MDTAKSIELKDIPRLSYEGYYWYSDAKKPQLVQNSQIDINWFSSLPFVVEANFYAKAEKISIQINNRDGIYHITRFDLSQVQETATLRIGHRLEGNNFWVVEGWEKQENELLAGFFTLKPAWTAFAGFTTKQN